MVSRLVLTVGFALSFLIGCADIPDTTGRVVFVFEPGCALPPSYVPFIAAPGQPIQTARGVSEPLPDEEIVDLSLGVATAQVIVSGSVRLLTSRGDIALQLPADRGAVSSYRNWLACEMARSARVPLGLHLRIAVPRSETIQLVADLMTIDGQRIMIGSFDAGDRCEAPIQEIACPRRPTLGTRSIIDLDGHAMCVVDLAP